MKKVVLTHPRLVLVRHAVALGLVMAALLPLVGWHGVFSSDEGALRAQIETIRTSDGSWLMPHPMPDVDPRGDHFPLARSARSGDQFAPLAKKPLYVVTALGATTMGGAPAAMAMSIAGTIVAALLAGWMAGRLQPSLAVPAFWLAAVGTPLLVDGYLLIAHTLGAALCGSALVGAFLTFQGRRSAGLLLTGLSLAAAVMLRNEAVLYGLALVCSGLVLRSVPMRTRLPIGASAFAGTVCGWFLDGLAVDSVAPGSTQMGAPAAGSGSLMGYVRDRINGLLDSAFRPAYGELPSLAVLAVLVSAAILVLAAVVRWRGGSADRVRLVALVGLGASAASLALLTADSPVIIPGLVITAPVAIGGLLLLRREHLEDVRVRLVLATTLVFAALVVLAQYSTGGTWEWGGRYFAVAMPGLAVLASVGWIRGTAGLERETRGLAFTAASAAALALSAIGVQAVSSMHDGWASFVSLVTSDAAAVSPGDGGQPVIITSEGELPRAAWSSMDDFRWLLVDQPDLMAVGRRVAESGISGALVVTKSDQYLEELSQIGFEAVRTKPAPADWIVSEVRLPGAPD